jgi:hypothetical protein
MLKSDLKTLAPRAGSLGRQKLTHIDPLTVAATAAITTATGAACKYVAGWVYHRYVHPRRKAKTEAKKMYLLRHGIEVQIIEELSVRTRTRRTKTFRVVSRQINDKV